MRSIPVGKVSTVVRRSGTLIQCHVSNLAGDWQGEPITVRRSRGSIAGVGKKQEGRTVLEGQPSASMVGGSGLCFAPLSTVPVTGWRGFAERQQVSR